MKKKEIITMQDGCVDALIKSLPLLRVATKMTQAQLAEKVGVSRQTIVAIETRKRPLPWTLYLAMVLVFQQYEESSVLLRSLKLFDDNFIQQIK